MSYNNYYMRLRVKAVQEFDRMYHEPEYKAKCHKRVWKRLGCYIFGISYQSYLDYLKMDVSDVPPTPLEAQQAKRKLVDKLLERELQVKKQPVRRKEPEEVKKEPVEQERRQLFSGGAVFRGRPVFSGRGSTHRACAVIPVGHPGQIFQYRLQTLAQDDHHPLVVVVGQFRGCLLVRESHRHQFGTQHRQIGQRNNRGCAHSIAPHGDPLLRNRQTPRFLAFFLDVPQHVLLGLRDIEIERRFVHILGPVSPKIDAVIFGREIGTDAAVGHVAHNCPEDDVFVGQLRRAQLFQGGDADAHLHHVKVIDCPQDFFGAEVVFVHHGVLRCSSMRVPFCRFACGSIGMKKGRFR